MDQLTAEILEYQSLRDDIEGLEKRKKVLRDSLLDTVQNAGERDEKGHLWLALDSDVNGVSSVQAERRVTQTLNEERAQEILEGLGLSAECTKTITVVDEDAVWAARWDDKLSDSDIEAMFDTKVVTALKLKS